MSLELPSQAPIASLRGRRVTQKKGPDHLVRAFACSYNKHQNISIFDHNADLTLSDTVVVCDRLPLVPVMVMV
jgi:hypothetical protein